VDWDGDGIGDILVGDADGFVNLFRRLPSGELTRMPLIQYGYKPLRVYNNAAPAVTDWNADGLPDLIIGSFAGYPAGLHLYLNSGEPWNPLFMDSTAVEVGGSPVELCKVYPQVADMNSDGLFDLVAGSADGYLYCFINVGTAFDPEFEEPSYLESEGSPIWHISATRPYLADWNNDGTLDILVSDQSGTITLYPGLPTGIEGSQTEDFPGELRASPVTNPCADLLELWIEGASSGQITIGIFSINGRLLASVERVLNGGGCQTVSMPLASGRGVYLVRCTQQQSVCTTRFVTTD
jgi:hypothetical protein